MQQQAPKPPNRLLTSRTNRRRFLTALGIVAALTPSAVTRAATEAIGTQNQGGAIMGRQAEVTATTDALTAPGVQLFYDVSGSGPVLLLIPGGMADAGGFAPLAAYLEDRYTVVRYDPRGISRSRLDGPAEDVPVEVHADDAARLLKAIGGEPAYVVGSSGGAVIGLALVERYPELVETLVAHEPPLVEFLPEGDKRRDDNQAIYDTYRTEGVGPAMEKFWAAAGMDEEAPPVDMSPEALEFMAQEMARMEQNLEFFLAHYLMPITSYDPDIAALQAASSRVVIGVGEASGGQEASDTALALAERLGIEPVTFPGDHIGMATHPEAFTAKLHEVLQAR